MLMDNVEHLSRDLTLALRDLGASGMASEGLDTLLRVVLRLKNVGDYPCLRDTLGALLLQLDFSWTDPASEKTARILQTILTFVQSFEKRRDGEDKEDEEEDGVSELDKCFRRNRERGAITKFVLGREGNQKSVIWQITFFYAVVFAYIFFQT